MEVETTVAPKPGFLADVRRLCDEHGALLIFDEMITGFRWHLRGAAHVHGVHADLTTYGKALGNGFAIAALVGRRDVMELGGLRTDQERVFLLSTTYGAETHTMAAAIAAIGVYESEPDIRNLHPPGERHTAWGDQARHGHRHAPRFSLIGRPPHIGYY